MADQTVSWNRIITICSVFGIPLISVCFAGVVLITRLDDKMTNFQIKQVEQGYDIKDIKADLNALKTRVDTVAQRQREDRKDNEYRWLLENHKKK